MADWPPTVPTAASDWMPSLMRECILFAVPRHGWGSFDLLLALLQPAVAQRGLAGAQH